MSRKPDRLMLLGVLDELALNGALEITLSRSTAEVTSTSFS